MQVRHILDSIIESDYKSEQIVDYRQILKYSHQEMYLNLARVYDIGTLAKVFRVITTGTLERLRAEFRITSTAPTS